jgi:hypothetical protein
MGVSKGIHRIIKQNKHNHIPRVAMIIDTAISIVLFGIGTYHFTRPNAWRSGTIEFISTALLLTAAYLVDRKKAMLIQLLVALPLCAIGIRHLTHGGGWKSGTTELFFVILLVANAYIIHKFGKR